MSGPPPIPPRPTDPPPIPPRPDHPGKGPPSFPPQIRGKLIANGTSAQSGVLAGKKGIKWQSSGILEEGANLTGLLPAISDPYTIHMGPVGTCLDEKGRQRTEFLSWPPAEAGQTNLYKWRFHLSPDLPADYKFFHMTQLFSREQGGFVLSLGLVRPSKMKISTIIPECEGVAKDNVMECDAKKYWGRTAFHRMLVKWGPSGSIDYTVRDVETNELLLRYVASNVNVPAKGSIKCGLYRAHVFSPASAVVGDFDFSKRS
ncbi:uncharacterized protein JCM6883_000163 [Sporobolomyces salmoneus]|uniref:uncharacterized protein n=1 Tax=Sporobolomyces salmoneus TaxID=183962 RepID=UPI00316D9AF5